MNNYRDYIHAQGECQGEMHNYACIRENMRILPEVCKNKQEKKRAGERGRRRQSSETKQCLRLRGSWGEKKAQAKPGN
ncbi:MAG: hypothetical protein IJ773_11080 [Lachnospiraceae bacterium]|nr:hypothetical protein [Lachnospiraceae bacterium]